MNFAAGDIIAFYGTGFLSNAIEHISHGPSHVAMILDPTIPVDGAPQTEVMIIESTKEDGRSGPQINPLAARQASYTTGARVYHLSLADNIRTFLDWTALWTLAVHKLHGDSYNVLELGEYVLRDLPFVSYIPKIHQANPNQEVCSEFICELLRAGGIPALDPPQTAPGKLVSFKLYKAIDQIQGYPTSILNFNTI